MERGRNKRADKEEIRGEERRGSYERRMTLKWRIKSKNKNKNKNRNKNRNRNKKI